MSCLPGVQGCAFAPTRTAPVQARPRRSWPHPIEFDQRADGKTELFGRIGRAVQLWMRLRHLEAIVDERVADVQERDHIDPARLAYGEGRRGFVIDRQTAFRPEYLQA